jgi:hypothetical protein
MIVGQMVKEPGEEITVGIDFTMDLDLVAVETVDSAVVTSKNYATLVDTSASFLSLSAPEIDTPIVSKRCRGGAHGETHLVQIQATTNLGNVYEHEVEVIVAES